MSLNSRDFVAMATRICGKSPASQLGEYIASNKDKTLDEVVEECLKDNSLKSYVPKFARAVTTVHERHVLETSVNLGLETGELGEVPPQAAREFKVSCKQALIKNALEENIPVATRQYIGADADNEYFTKKFLDLNGIDQDKATKEYLKWINCVAEFHCGEALFKHDKEGKRQGFTLDHCTNPSLEDVGDKRITLKGLAQKEQAEKLLYDLWEQGYLQCNMR